MKTAVKQTTKYQCAWCGWEYSKKGQAKKCYDKHDREHQRRVAAGHPVAAGSNVLCLIHLGEGYTKKETCRVVKRETSGHEFLYLVEREDEQRLWLHERFVKVAP